MKPKEIIILVVTLVIIGVCGYFSYQMLFPSAPQVSKAGQTTTNVPKIPANINEDSSYTNVQNLSDYGKPDLSNIGKSDLFAN